MSFDDFVPLFYIEYTVDGVKKETYINPCWCHPTEPDMINISDNKQNPQWAQFKLIKKVVITERSCSFVNVPRTGGYSNKKLSAGEYKRPYKF